MPDELIEQLDGLIAARPHLRDWTHWCARRQMGVAKGLEPIIVDLEEGRLSPDQTRAGVSACIREVVASQVIDNEPALRDFSASSMNTLSTISQTR